MLDPPVGARDADGDDPARLVDEKRLRASLVDAVDARLQRRLPQPRGERGAGALRQRVHARRAVAGIEEAVEHARTAGRSASASVSMTPAIPPV